jgi:hypothetical protein
VKGRRRSPAALLAFFALTAPFGIAAHLLSELFGLGWHDDADVIFSARHAYLALIAVAALASLSAALLALPRGERRERVATLVDALPRRGSGPGFLLLAFVAQFGFFALTQIGEGCPLCGGDIVTGVVAAGIAALLGALAVTFGKRRILELALQVMCEFVRIPSAPDIPSNVRAHRVAPATAARRSPFAFRYRPPPVAA